MRKNRIVADSNSIRILALDDDPTMTVTLQSYFNASGYRVDTENDPNKAVERIRSEHYDILLLDFLMTPICGDKVVAAIREFNTDLFIILLTGHKSMAPPVKTIRELNIQGYYEKSDRFDQLELLVESCVKSIRQLDTIREYRDSLEETNDRLNRANKQLADSFRETVNTLRSTVDARDLYTRGHSDRVALLSAELSKALGRSEADTERIRLAGQFHDIGKIKIPDRILLKDGLLTPEEIDEMRRHPVYSEQILSGAAMFNEILPAVRSHHERCDGRGYPDGLAGDAICEDARIICLADSFDAMTSFRRYRKNMTVAEARDEIARCAGRQFDPALAPAFIKLLDRFDELSADPGWVYPA